MFLDHSTLKPKTNTQDPYSISSCSHSDIKWSNQPFLSFYYEC